VRGVGRDSLRSSIIAVVIGVGATHTAEIVVGATVATVVMSDDAVPLRVSVIAPRASVALGSCDSLSLRCWPAATLYRWAAAPLYGWARDYCASLEEERQT
jgi:hypothetical protein